MDVWKKIQRQNFVDWKKLLLFVGLDQSIQEICPNPKFPLNLPLRLAKKIEKNSLQDPILKQFLPLKIENIKKPGFCFDPLEESRFRLEKKLLHKYKNRALLVCTSACVMHCRFCFRKNFDYDTEDKLFDEEIKAIEQDSSLSEILLSGGDPLSLSNKQLQFLLSELSKIPHVKRIRFHTRFPIGIPERIDAELLHIFQSTPCQILFVIHTNHPKELDSDVLETLEKIRKLGIPILTQTVLLKDINDNESILEELFTIMINHGILPYYLHQLDPIDGTTHFEVEPKRALELISYLKTVLPGYAVPRYVKEIPGETSKRVLA